VTILINCNADYFTYNNVSSEEYELILASIDTTINQEVGGGFEYTTYRNAKSPQHKMQEIKYEKSFEYEVEFLSPYTKLDDKFNEICNWLLNRSNFAKFKLNSWSDEYINCIFTDAEKIQLFGEEGYGIYGIKATLKADSVFKWSEVSTTYTYDELVNTVNLENNTDVREYTYPTLIIKTGETGGDIVVQNVSDNNRLISITDALPNDTITISSFPKTITSLLKNREPLYESFNKKFPRLMQGTNNIGIVGDISELTFNYKIGKVIN